MMYRVQLVEDLSKGRSAWGMWHALMMWVSSAVEIYARFYLLVIVALRTAVHVKEIFGFNMRIVVYIPVVIFGFSIVALTGLCLLTAVTDTSRQFCREKRECTAPESIELSLYSSRKSGLAANFPPS